MIEIVVEIRFGIEETLVNFLYKVEMEAEMKMTDVFRAPTGHDDVVRQRHDNDEDGGQQQGNEGMVRVYDQRDDARREPEPHR